MEASRLKINSKRLESGRYQIQFSTHNTGHDVYGYMLTEAQTPVREVVEKISRHIDEMKWSERYFQRNLFSLTKRQTVTGKILVFRCDKNEKKQAA